MRAPSPTARYERKTPRFLVLPRVSTSWPFSLYPSGKPRQSDFSNQHIVKRAKAPREIISTRRSKLVKRSIARRFFLLRQERRDPAELDAAIANFRLLRQDKRVLLAIALRH